ncbi:hypothetical protein PENTCL1PPCAC_19034, partial [Pristionchus entomophagus]
SFDNCDGVNSKCFTNDDTGIRIDIVSDFEWTVSLAWLSSISDSKFKLQIGGSSLMSSSNSQGTSGEESGVKVLMIGVGRDTTVKQSKISLKADSAKKEPIFDILRLYTLEKVTVHLNGAGLGSKLFKLDCTSANLPKPGDTAELPSKTVNEFKCKDTKHNKLIFLDKKNTNLDTVFCSKRGWRDSSHAYIDVPYSVKSVYCYTDDPPVPLPMFNDCNKATKKCFTLDKTPPQKLIVKNDANPAPSSSGVELDIANELEWIVTVAHEKPASCALSIGAKLKFDCGDLGKNSQTVNGVTVTRDADGTGRKDKLLKYEKYRIKANGDPLDPVIDSLEYYINRKQ